MNLLNKPIEDVIQSLYDGIKSKKEIIANFRKDYKLNDEKEQTSNFNSSSRTM